MRGSAVSGVELPLQHIRLLIDLDERPGQEIPLPLHIERARLPQFTLDPQDSRQHVAPRGWWHGALVEWMVVAEFGAQPPHPRLGRRECIPGRHVVGAQPDRVVGDAGRSRRGGRSAGRRQCLPHGDLRPECPLARTRHVSADENRSILGHICGDLVALDRAKHLVTVGRIGRQHPAGERRLDLAADVGHRAPSRGEGTHHRKVQAAVELDRRSDPHVGEPEDRYLDHISRLQSVVAGLGRRQRRCRQGRDQGPREAAAAPRNAGEGPDPQVPCSHVA
jgi:hypothetical protein